MTGDEFTQQSDTLVLDGAVTPDQVEVEVAGGAVAGYDHRFGPNRSGLTR